MHDQNPEISVEMLHEVCEMLREPDEEQPQKAS